MAIGEYSIDEYLCLLLSIILMVFGEYSIDGYLCLLLTITLVVINDCYNNVY
jgi:hypothetical protein